MKPLVVALCCLPLASCASTSPPVGPAAVTIEEVPHAAPVCDKSTRARITQIVETNLPVVLRLPAESVHRRVYADAMFDALDEARGLSADERPGSGTTDFNRIADERRTATSARRPDRYRKVGWNSRRRSRRRRSVVTSANAPGPVHESPRGLVIIRGPEAARASTSPFHPQANFGASTRLRADRAAAPRTTGRRPSCL